MNNILVVDDDRNILKVIEMRLDSEGYGVVTASCAEDAMNIAAKETFNLALLDLKLNNSDGIELMGKLHQIHPEMAIIILTAFGTIENAVKAIQKGADNYLTKPFDYRELLFQVKNCLGKSSSSTEVKNLKSSVDKRYGFKTIIGTSKKMGRVFNQVMMTAKIDSNVYIEGESGTGKELIAKTLHNKSLRKKGPFIAINCAAIPETLFESEMFGFKKGAFSGAVHDRKGFFAQSHGGSIFFDEISEIPLNMQVKLLRVLEEKEFYPLGGTETVKIDTRIISASNKNLDQEVKKGNFREDLFYRIHVVPINIPALRERKEDIPLLVKHFIQKTNLKLSKNIKDISPPALQKLMEHTWPGNVRQLENTIEYAAVMATNDFITKDLVLDHVIENQKSDKESIKTYKHAKDAFEKQYIKNLIKYTNGNVSKAAKLAGKYRADLYDIFKKHDLDPSKYRERSAPTCE